MNSEIKEILILDNRIMNIEYCIEFFIVPIGNSDSYLWNISITLSTLTLQASGRAKSKAILMAKNNTSQHNSCFQIAFHTEPFHLKMTLIKAPEYDTVILYTIILFHYHIVEKMGSYME